MSKVKMALLGAALLGLSTTALAWTLQELQDRADALQADLDTIAAQVDACPSGHCSERPAIEADFAAAEDDRSDLHADRDAMNPCLGCEALDGSLDAIDADATTVGVIIKGWDDQG